MEERTREPFDFSAELEGICDTLVALQVMFNEGNDEKLSPGALKGVLYAIQQHIDRVNEEWSDYTNNLEHQLMEMRGGKQ